MKKDDLKKINIPKSSGVYFFYKDKDLLYIGKATALLDRINSYFSSDLIETRGPHIVDMVFKANKISWQQTDTTIEALILEANLIKKHQPYYNTKEKDDKSWNYVCITKEDIPKVIVLRGKEIDFKNKTSKKYKFESIFGPYTSGISLREALRIIRKIFPFIDELSLNKYNKEFYRQLGLVPEKLSLYKNSIKHIKLFFEGKKKLIILKLKKEMVSCARKQEFEKADIYKKQIFALEHINDIALIKNENKTYSSNFMIESYDIAHMSGLDQVGVMTVVIDGEIKKDNYKKFIIKTQKNANDTGALEEVLSRRFRHTEWGMPDLVVVDGGLAQLHVAEQVLNRYQLKIPIVSVLKDEHHKPKDLLGDKIMIKKHKKSILLSNSESHRFAIAFHKQKRSKKFFSIK